MSGTDVGYGGTRRSYEHRERILPRSERLLARCYRAQYRTSHSTLFAAPHDATNRIAPHLCISTASTLLQYRTSHSTPLRYRTSQYTSYTQT
eukprot:2701252-Rhodomonas_salina.4